MSTASPPRQTSSPTAPQPRQTPSPPTPNSSQPTTGGSSPPRFSSPSSDTSRFQEVPWQEWLTTKRGLYVRHDRPRIAAGLSVHHSLQTDPSVRETGMPGLSVATTHIPVAPGALAAKDARLRAEVTVKRYSEQMQRLKIDAAERDAPTDVPLRRCILLANFSALLAPLGPAAPGLPLDIEERSFSEDPAQPGQAERAERTEVGIVLDAATLRIVHAYDLGAMQPVTLTPENLAALGAAPRTACVLALCSEDFRATVTPAPQRLQSAETVRNNAQRILEAATAAIVTVFVS